MLLYRSMVSAVSGYGNLTELQNTLRKRSVDSSVREAAAAVIEQGQQVQKESLEVRDGQVELIKHDTSDEQLGKDLLTAHQHEFVNINGTSPFKDFLLLMKERINYLLEAIHTMHHNEWDFNSTVGQLGDQGEQVQKSMFETMGKSWRDIASAFHSENYVPRPAG